MRTKAVFCAAAVAVGAISAMAQTSNVYSLNVVGYVNVPFKGGGFTLAANQLSTGTNGINQVIPVSSYGDQILTFKNNDYTIDVFDGTSWLDNNTGDPSSTTLPPGKGFFYQSLGSTLTNTFVGEVLQGQLTVTVAPGFSLVGTMTPQLLELTAGNGFPQVYGNQVLYFNNTINDYVIYVNDGTQWLDNNTGDPVTLAPAVGQGWFIQNLESVNHDWVRNFTVQ